MEERKEESDGNGDDDEVNTNDFNVDAEMAEVKCILQCRLDEANAENATNNRAMPEPKRSWVDERSFIILTVLEALYPTVPNAPSCKRVKKTMTESVKKTVGRFESHNCCIYFV